jgi:hypothetical protein
MALVYTPYGSESNTGLYPYKVSLPWLPARAVQTPAVFARDFVARALELCGGSLRRRSYLSSEVSTRPYSSAPCFLTLSR